jgi:hypothetical protein
VRQLRQANEILRKASAYFAQPPLAVCLQTAARCRQHMLACVRGGNGNSTARSSHDRLYSLPGSACRHAREGVIIAWCMGAVRSAGSCRLPHLLPGKRIAQQFCREGTYYACLAVRADPSKASARQQRDAALRPKTDTSGMTTRRFTVSAKPDGNCAVKVKLWRGSHRGAPHDRHVFTGNRSKKRHENNDPRHVSAMPTR